MSNNRHIIFLLLCIFQISFSDSTDQNKEYLKFKPLSEADISEAERNAIDALYKEQLRQCSESEKPEPTEKTNNLSEEEIDELEFIFETSPKKAQEIVKHLQDPTYCSGNPDYRSRFFVGEPGTGKTMMAKAIAYKMAQHGWKSKYLRSTELLGEYRNQTAVYLEKELKETVSSGTPTIIIIDEVNKLLENTENKNNDTDLTATALWGLLDEHRRNKNLFFIGTMNRITKLPKPLKERIVNNFINFELITDPKIKIKIFRKHLTTKYCSLDAEVTDDFLHKELEKIKYCSGRTLQNTADEINKIHNSNNPDKTPVNKISITQGIAESIQHTETIQYDLKEETDEERQERYHKENMRLQEEQRAQQQQQYKESMRLQEEQRAQQQQQHKESMDSQGASFSTQQATQIILSVVDFALRIALHKYTQAPKSSRNK